MTDPQILYQIAKWAGIIASPIVMIWGVVYACTYKPPPPSSCDKKTSDSGFWYFTGWGDGNNDSDN